MDKRHKKTAAKRSNLQSNKLVQNCRTQLLEHLLDHLRFMYDDADQVLLDRVLNATNNTEASFFSENAQEIKDSRDALVNQYSDSINQKLQDYVEGNTKPKDEFSSTLDADDISLLEHDEYEENLQVINMASRVQSRCTQALFGLEQRLAMLTQSKINESLNPFGPRLIAQAFRDSLTQSDIELVIRIELYKLYEKHVMKSLDVFYAKLNQFLVDSDILPNLKFKAKANASKGGDKVSQKPLKHDAINRADSHEASGDFFENQITNNNDKDTNNQNTHLASNASSAFQHNNPNPPIDGKNGSVSSSGVSSSGASSSGVSSAGASSSGVSSAGASSGSHGYGDTSMSSVGASGTKWEIPDRSGSTADMFRREADIEPLVLDNPEQLFKNLFNLLKEQKTTTKGEMAGGAPSISSFGSQTATATYSSSELFSAIDLLQQTSIQSLRQGQQETQRVDYLKEQLHYNLESLSSTPGQQKLDEHEADVIDLVGMLFEYILDDQTLPDVCKTALSHLHTPYLKIALQNKALFTQPSHPARQLLNHMAEAGSEYGVGDEDRGLLTKMYWVVEQVLKEYANDLTLFDHLIDEFNAFVEMLKNQVNSRERRSIEAAKGRDKLVAAKQRANQFVDDLIKDKGLPEFIRSFLDLTWTDVLAFVSLRKGPVSQEWKDTCQVAEQLVWSCTPLSPEDRARLLSVRIQLLRDIQAGLEILGGYNEAGVHRLMQDIVSCQKAVQARKTEATKSIKLDQVQSKLGVMLGEDIKLTQKNVIPAEVSDKTREIMLELQKLEFGTWFEFIDGSNIKALKLAWYSPTTQNYMFVDRSGQRVALKHLEQLAQELELGQVRVYAPERDSPLVDRALSAIYRTMKKFTGRASDATN